MSPPQVIVPSSASAQRQRFAAAYSVLEQGISQQAFPGVSFGVLARGEVLALDGIGGFTYGQPTEAVNASTVYDLASVTKVIATTSMAMLLYQKGQLSLDQPLVQIFPAFAQGEGARGQVTLRMLLAHSSGLPGYARLFEVARDRDALLHACLHLPLEAAPGSRAEYSDPGFILLGRALEIIAGESVENFCSREVFFPLGMTSTCFRPPAEWRSAIPPTEEDLTFRHRIVQGEVQDENCFVLGGAGGHAGLFSNALDPLLYAQSLFDPAALHGGDDSTVHDPRPTGRQLPGAGMGYTFPAFLLRQVLQPPLSRPSRLRGNFPVDRLRTPARRRAAHQSYLAAPPEPGHSYYSSCLS